MLRLRSGLLRRAMANAQTFRRYVSTAAGSEAILIAAPPRMRVVDLHRPAALNALNSEMVATLLPLVQNWQQADGDVKLVVFRGAGERAFCAGGDIRFLRECSLTGTAEGRAPALDFFRGEYSLNHAIGTSRVPIVSLLEGIVMGGGVGLSVHGHVRVATESTLFAMPETGIGFFPDVGGTYFLPRLRGALGMYLGLTGARLRGRDVLTAGVATHYLPSERIEALEAILLELAAKTANKAYTLESNQDFVEPDVLATALASLEQVGAGAMGASNAADAEAPPPMLTDEALAEIDEIFGLADVGEITEAVNALAAGAAGAAGASTPPQPLHWAVGAARELARASPTSLAVTHAALKRGKQCSSLAECLQMEFRMAQRFLRHPDMASGIGAVLSKGADRAVWAPPPTVAEVDEFFAAGEGGELVLES